MKFIFAGFLLLTLLGCSHTAQQSIDSSATSKNAVPTTYQLQGTTTFTLNSNETGGTYNIAISFPASFASADAAKTYPVIYVLDGQWQFPLVNAIVGAVNYDGDMPEALVVGISWQETNGDLMTQRVRDLTHSAVGSSPESGNAMKFQHFLRNELFPHIEKHYKGGRHRTVTGGSLSSLFAAYTLLSQPDLFDGYIVSSPSIGWDNESINKLLENFPTNAIHKKTRFYLSWGSLEFATNIKAFVKKLEHKKLDNLKLLYAPVDNSGHAGVNAETYTKGLQFVFQKEALHLSPDILQALSGRYKNKDNGDEMQFAVKDGKLHWIFPNGESFVLRASSNNEFYVQGNAMTFRFDSQTNSMRFTHHGTGFDYTRR